MLPSEYIRPSGASNWVRCSGYAKLNASVEAPLEDEGDTEVREDGTACHWLATERYADRRHPSGTVSFNGRVITDEMQSAVSDYIGVMHNIGDIWHIEEKAPVSAIIPNVQDGTPDAWHFDGTTLTILDLKFGYRFVDAFENLQLVIYALTIIFGVLKAKPENIKIRLGIFQPRCPNHMGPLRWWSPTAMQLDSLHGLLLRKAAAAMSADPLCTPHPGCKHCPAAFACHALRMAAAEATEAAYAAVPAVLGNERLGYEMAIRHKAMQMLEAQIAGLETQVEHALRHGERVMGYELSPRRTLWRWKEGAQERLAALASLLGEQLTEVKMKSVAQLRAVLPAQLIDMYAEKPNGGLQLKAIDPKEIERRMQQ